MAKPTLYVFEKGTETLKLIITKGGEGLPLLSAYLTEEINKAQILEFTIPSNHEQSALINPGDIVVLKDLDGAFIPFKIGDDEETHEYEFERYFYCEHLAVTELNDHVVLDVRPQNKPADEAITSILSNNGGSGWVVGHADDFGINSTNVYYESAMEGLRKVVDVWGGELRFRVTMDTLRNKITGRYVDLYAQLGSFTGKRFEFGKDIKSIKRNIVSSTVKTALYGRGKGEETDSGGYGRRLTFKDVVWSVADGDPMDKPAGQEWIGDEDARLIWGHLVNGEIKHAAGVYLNDQQTDAEKLLEETYQSLLKQKEPQVNYKASVIDLEKALPGFQHEAVRLGDVVFVIDHHFSVVTRLSVRVIKLKRDLLEPENTDTELGTPRNDISSMIRNLEGQIKDKVGMGDPIGWLEGTIDAERTEFESRNSYVYINDVDGILITNRPRDNIDNPPDQAIQLKGGALAIANAKNQTGDWDWRTFITGEHVVADFIQAGSMLADRIRGGDLYIGGIIDGIGKNGRLFMLDETDEIAMQFDALTRSVDRLFIGELSGDNCVLQTTEDMQYFVDPEFGSDENDGSSEFPFLTLAQAINNLPNVISHVIDIFISANAIFEEEVRISGKIGEGAIQLNYSGAKQNGWVRVDSNAMRVKLDGGTIVHTGTIAQQDVFAKGCITASVTNAVTATNMILDANNKAAAGFYAEDANATLNGCALYRGATGSSDGLVNANNGSNVVVIDCKGNGSTYGLMAKTGATIAGYGTRPNGTTGASGTVGGGVVTGTWSSGDSGTTPPATTQPGILTKAALSGASWDTSFGWNGNYPRQGDPSRWSASMGNCRGLWFFDYASIQSALAGKTITSIRILVQRQASGGLQSSVPIYFWTHNNTSASGGMPGLLGGTNAANFKPGEKKWVNLPVSMGTAIRNNTAKGIGIYVNSANSDYYSRFAVPATLEIKYT